MNLNDAGRLDARSKDVLLGGLIGGLSKSIEIVEEVFGRVVELILV